MRLEAIFRSCLGRKSRAQSCGSASRASCTSRYERSIAGSAGIASARMTITAHGSELAWPRATACASIGSLSPGRASWASSPVKASSCMRRRGRSLIATGPSGRKRAAQGALWGQAGARRRRLDRFRALSAAVIGDRAGAGPARPQGGGWRDAAFLGSIRPMLRGCPDRSPSPTPRAPPADVVGGGFALLSGSAPFRLHTVALGQAMGRGRTGPIAPHAGP